MALYFSPNTNSYLPSNQCLLFLWHPEEYKGCGCVGGVTFNNTTLIEINGFYFEPVNVPADFCQSASTSTNTPWKAGRGKLLGIQFHWSQSEVLFGYIIKC